MSSSEMNSFEPSDEIAELEIMWREAVLFERLQEPIPERRDRGRFSLGRMLLNGAFPKNRLTFADVVRMNDSGEESTELLSGFVKRNDREASLILAETHLDMLEDYVVVRAVPDRAPKELEGYPVTSLDNIWGNRISESGRLRWKYPHVEGCGWARGDKIDISRDSSIVIYAPWVTLSEEGGSPFPVIYSKGEVSSDLITKLTSAYSDYLRGNFRAKLFYPDNQKIEQNWNLL